MKIAIGCDHAGVELKDELTVEHLEQLLTTTPVNMYKPSFMTLQSAIVEYEGEKARLLVSAGYDPLRGWNEYGFSKPPE